ncbi:hypothetical protein BGX27_011190 [Mortierella sp. AM989]|nr:hypothetical protein BGX27_011190 [Mortierella sp. AM989]
MSQALTLMEKGNCYAADRVCPPFTGLQYIFLRFPNIGNPSHTGEESRMHEKRTGDESDPKDDVSDDDGSSEFETDGDGSSEFETDDDGSSDDVTDNDDSDADLSNNECQRKERAEEKNARVTDGDNEQSSVKRLKREHHASSLDSNINRRNAVLGTERGGASILEEARRELRRREQIMLEREKRHGQMLAEREKGHQDMLLDREKSHLKMLAKREKSHRKVLDQLTEDQNQTLARRLEELEEEKTELRALKVGLKEEQAAMWKKEAELMEKHRIISIENCMLESKVAILETLIRGGVASEEKEGEEEHEEQE